MSDDLLKFKPTKDALSRAKKLHERIAAEFAQAKAEEKARENGNVTMPDGSILIIHPDTGESFYAMPADAEETMDFNQAKEYAAGLNINKTLGHDDWRLPSIDELKLLFGLQHIGALAKTFNHMSKRPQNTSNMYWSATVPTDSTRRDNNVFCLTFNGTGTPQCWYPAAYLSVRCVR
jgi:hypothetical protein